jgi:hypothetical protein
MCTLHPPKKNISKGEGVGFMITKHHQTWPVPLKFAREMMYQ